MAKFVYDTRQLPVVLTVPEAAELVRVTQDHIRKLLRTGDLQGTKVGKGWRIPKEELLKHMGITEHIA